MPDIRLEDTISAISTPPGEGGIGVIRLSGGEAVSIATKMFRSPTGTHLDEASTHTVHFGTIIDTDGNVIDEALVSVFRRPKSYTAEDVVEISGHGGSRVLQKILNLSLSHGARHAEPGEFTKRAFLNGRMDLAQAEAVLDLIRAKTDRSMEVALRQLAGKLSGEVQAIKNDLMHIYAHLEACLDFPEEHLEIYSNQDFKLRFERVQNHLEQLIRSFTRGEILREGASVILCGRPNVGKSSLLNAFLSRDRALVSEVPGTTRDVLEESVEWEGLWVRLMDTAGLWSSEHPVDQAAMEKTKKYFDEGDLFLWVIDGSESLQKEDLAVFKQINNKNVIAVINKVDICDSKSIKDIIHTVGTGEKVFSVSAKTKQGVDELQKRIVQIILSEELGQESVLVTRLRHKNALESALESVQKSFKAFLISESLEFVALDLKQSLDFLREFVGEIYSEDLLDVIFKEFCIGK